MMNAVDYVFIGIVGISALLSLFRGLVREALSLTVWIVAGTLALTFASRAAPMLSGVVAAENLRTPVAFVLLFVVVVMLGSIVSYLVAQIMRRHGMSGPDRMLGLLFGVARGALIVSALVLVATVTPIAEQPWWQEAQLPPHFQPLASWLRQYLPTNLSAVVPS